MPVSEYVRNIRSRIGNDLLMSCAAAGIVVNEKGEVLLQRRSDNGIWGIPGGMIEPGEQPADAVIREVYEETGIKVKPLRISGVYGGPDYSITYPNGDRIVYVSVAFLCQPIGGELQTDNDESLEVRYVSPAMLQTLGVEPKNLDRIHHALQNSETTFFRV